MKSLQFTLLFFVFISCQQKESKTFAVSNPAKPATFAEKLSQAAISIINPRLIMIQLILKLIILMEMFQKEKVSVRMS